LCKTNYYTQVFDLTPEELVFEKSKPNFEQKLEENARSILLKKSTNRINKNEYTNANAETAEQSEAEL